MNEALLKKEALVALQQSPARHFIARLSASSFQTCHGIGPLGIVDSRIESTTFEFIRDISKSI